jgi:hypothetical protein
MSSHGYTISDTSSTLYRFDIPAKPTALCPNLKKIPGAVRPPAPRSTSFTGLATVKGKVVAIAEHGGFYKGLNSPPTLFKNTGTQLFGLSYNPLNNTLYSFSQNKDGPTGMKGHQLVKVNFASGAITKVGAVQPQSVDGLAISANGKAYASDGLVSNALYEVNLITGNLTLVGSFQLNIGQQTGLEFDPAQPDALYLLTETGKLYRANLASGQLKLHCDTNLSSKIGENNARFDGLTIVSERLSLNQTPDPAYSYYPLSVLVLMCSFICLFLKSWSP